MGRAPFQVLVILYMRKGDKINYCVFERKNPLCQFQFIAGGGEDAESPLQAAIREVFEESGVKSADFQQLTSLCYIPTNIFSEAQRKTWGENLYIIPEYSFGAEVKSDKIKISDEHIGFKWCTYEQAIDLLKWDSNRTALYELSCRLLN